MLLPSAARMVPVQTATLASIRPTPGGGGGGGVFSTFSRIHLPRRTGEVRVGIRSHGENAGLRQNAAALGAVEIDAAELLPVTRECRRIWPAARSETCTCRR